MEINRANPPPSFPTCINKFYYTTPVNWKEKTPKECSHKEKRDISPNYLIKKRFPKLFSESPKKTVFQNTAHQSMSPKRGYMKPTQEFESKIRSPSPKAHIRSFFAGNCYEAKQMTERIANGFHGSPYDARKFYSAKEQRDSIQKRLSGEFKPAYFEKSIEESPYMTSFNIPQSN